MKPVCTAPADVKQASSGDVCHANVPIYSTDPIVKHTVVSDAGHANVNHVCETDANVKPLCINDMSDHVASSSVHVQ